MSGESLVTGSSQVEFDRSVYSLDDIKKASYRLTDRGSFAMEETPTTYICTVFSKEPEGITSLMHDLRNEVLDQNLRTSIARETEPVRNLILAHTFSNTGLVDE